MTATGSFWFTNGSEVDGQELAVLTDVDSWVLSTGKLPRFQAIERKEEWASTVRTRKGL